MMVRMLYTRKGDKGDTGLFGCNQRISKSSAIAEALGTLDECNSFLGVCRARARKESAGAYEKPLHDILFGVQNILFTVQAEIAGTEKTVPEGSVREVERVIDAIEKTLPPIKSFFVPGATPLSAHLDFARTLARRAERRVVAVAEEGSVSVGEHTLRYLNRLSSLLYALARSEAAASGEKETPPQYAA